MGTSLTAYIQLLELVVFFSGYALLFLLVYAIAGPSKSKDGFFKRVQKLLPLSYALAGTLFVGLLAKNTFIDYQLTHKLYLPENLWLTGWAILSLLFWLKFFQARPFFALAHSLVYFFMVAKIIYQYAAGNSDQETLLTYMKLYADSIIFNAGILLLLYLILIIYTRFRKPNRAAAQL